MTLSCRLCAASPAGTAPDCEGAWQSGQPSCPLPLTTTVEGEPAAALGSLAALVTAGHTRSMETLDHWALRHMAVSTLPRVSPGTSSSGTEPHQARLISSPFLCPPARLWHSYRTKCQSCLPLASGHLLFQMSLAAQAFINHWPLVRIAVLPSWEWPLTGCRDRHQPHSRPLLHLLLRTPVVPGTAEHPYPPDLATPAFVS